MWSKSQTCSDGGHASPYSDLPSGDRGQRVHSSALQTQGYGTLCTSAVVEELLSQSLDVVLNVGQDNEPAVKIYQRLGFHVYCPFVEALGARNGGSGNNCPGR